MRSAGADIVSTPPASRIALWPTHASSGDQVGRTSGSAQLPNNQRFHNLM
jgi:hypothetical protein